ncbi:MAG: ParB/RepB/Spo0J family partition protein [Oscillospiraceae bacterium]|jgi:ParB family chromosome partitioning protein|nr:ParB/RepB/Spo0J family partition protein [Oscillospiraceae bacterium]
MQLTKKRGLYDSGRVVYLAAESISVNPATSRRTADPGAMRELSASIAKYGVLQPLTVRREGRGYELVSGERRLCAAKLAGVRDVPCIVLDVGEEQSAAIVLVENLQRRDLDFLEEARALDRLRELYNYSQEEIARLVGRSQPAVANKLRLLKLPPELLYAVRAAGLTERHARALLRLPTEQAMASALGRMIADDMNVSQAEEYIEEQLGVPRAAPPEPVPEKIPARPVIMVKDYRFFVNSVERGAEIMRKNGLAVSLEKTEDDATLTITVTVAKKPAPQA